MIKSKIQRYIKKLNNIDKLTGKVTEKTRPQNTKLGRVHGVPKVHKTFNSIPPFRPTIDTTGTTPYSLGKYLTGLLNYPT